MSLRRSIFSGVLTLGASQGANQLLAFVRNLLIIRFLPPEEFGLAAIFTLTVAFLKMISDMSSGRMLIQDPDGDEEYFQKSTQLFEVAKGLFLAVILFALADVFAWVYKAEHTAWAFRVLAIVPAMQGFGHQDLARYVRKLKYRPGVIANVAGQAASLIATYPLLLVCRDYSAVLWVMIVQTGVSMVVGHMLAERPYRLHYNHEVMVKLFRFGWPLLLNGLLLYVTMQGDRLLIAFFYTKDVLGYYSAAMTLSYVPTMMVLSIINPVMLPVLSQTQENAAVFQKRYEIQVQGLTFLSLAISFVFIFGGGDFIALIAGPEYRTTDEFIRWIAAFHCLRLIRTAPTLGAIAVGDTKNPLFANIFGTISFAPAFFVASALGPVKWIAACRLLGETMALASSVTRFRNRKGVPYRITYFPAFFSYLGMLLAALAVLSHPNPGWMFRIVALILGVGLAFAGMYLLFKPFRTVCSEGASWAKARLKK